MIVFRESQMERQRLIDTIRQWVQVDESIAELKAKVRERTAVKKELSTRLLTLMKDANLDEIDLADGKLVRQTRTTKSAVGKKYLQACLANYLKNDTKANEMSAFILGSREAKTVEVILKK